MYAYFRILYCNYFPGDLFGLFPPSYDCSCITPKILKLTNSNLVESLLIPLTIFLLSYFLQLRCSSSFFFRLYYFFHVRKVPLLFFALDLFLAFNTNRLCLVKFRLLLFWKKKTIKLIYLKVKYNAKLYTIFKF